MAAQSPTITQAAATAGLVKSGLLTALIERTAYVLKESEVLSDLTQPVGLVYLAVHSQATGFAYYYNASDTTTPDDGITCLVDFEGRRYLIADGADLNVSTVLALQNAPPGSPSIGDSYIVGVAPSGAWVGHANDIALWTLRGWVFAQPGVGQTVYNQATDGNTQYDESGNWVGFAISFSPGDIPNSALASMFGIAVEAVQNAPPVSPSTGQYYIVGGTGSGAFSGHNNAIAYWNGTSWEFYAPYDGAAAYNKSTDFNLNWNGSAWVSPPTSIVTTYSTVGSFTWDKPTIGTTAFIQVWGAGGSGGRAGSGDGGGGGGGGAYNEYTIPLSLLASSETVTVGAGGAARTADNTDGAAGGNSSFGSWVVGYGGGGGAGDVSAGGGGGGGGGWAAAGATPAGGGGSVTDGGAGGSGGDIEAGGAGGSGAIGANGNIHSGAGGGGGISAAVGGYRGGHAMYGGGGGGGGAQAGGGGSQQGGNSYFGGGGGGGSQAGGGTHAGGTSVRGGAGGTGRDTTNAAGAGAQPGGGGGGSCTGNSGKGGDGRVRITVF